MTGNRNSQRPVEESLREWSNGRRRFLTAGAALVAGTAALGAAAGPAEASSLLQEVYSGTAGLPAWANSTAYAVNQLATSNGAVYICSTAHTSAASPAHFPGIGTYWQAVGPSRQAVFIDEFGADPTGTNASDSAWTAAYAAATALVIGSPGGVLGGVMIEFGSGIYKFANTVKVSHPQIGIRGQGRGVTTIEPTGSGNDSLFITNTVGNTGYASAPVYGFTLDGSGTGANTTGLHYGDRYASYLNVEVIKFSGSGSQNVRLHNAQNTAAGCEGSTCDITSRSGGVSCVTFDGGSTSPGGSFDYSEWQFHVVGGNPNQPFALVKLINDAHINGGRLGIVGNIGASTLGSTTVLQIGAGSSDKAYVGNAELDVVVEVDVGTVSDLSIDADTSSSYEAGIASCFGRFVTFDAGGTSQAGTLSGTFQAEMAGYLSSPIFVSRGTLSTLGPSLSAWSDTITIAAGIDSTIGAIGPGNTAAGISGRIFAGTGAPNQPGGSIAYVAGGDWYFRNDTPETSGQRLYVCTTGGTSPTWTGIL